MRAYLFPLLFMVPLLLVPVAMLAALIPGRGAWLMAELLGLGFLQLALLAVSGTVRPAELRMLIGKR